MPSFVVVEDSLVCVPVVDDTVEHDFPFFLLALRPERTWR